MGNTQTVLAQFCSPPSPPTPLPPDKYFWIENSTCSRKGRREVVVDEEEVTPAPLTCCSSSWGNESILQRPEGRSAVPAVYIAGRSGADSDSDDSNDEEPPPRDASGRYTLLYCHGHDVDLGQVYDHLVLLSKLLGVDILSFDYAGYGLSRLGRVRKESSNGSTGSSSSAEDLAENDATINCRAPTEDQICGDILTCYEFLINEKNVPPEKIILYGKSLGGGPVCWLAHHLLLREARQNDSGAEENKSSKNRASGKSRSGNPKSETPPPPPLGGIVLHAAFLSVLPLVRRYGLAPRVGDAFDNVARLEGILSLSRTLPVYILHGKADEVVPLSHCKGLCDIVTEHRKGDPPFFFFANGGSHRNIEHKYLSAYTKRLQQFLAHCAEANGAEIAEVKFTSWGKMHDPMAPGLDAGLDISNAYAEMAKVRASMAGAGTSPRGVARRDRRDDQTRDDAMSQTTVSSRTTVAVRNEGKPDRDSGANKASSSNGTSNGEAARTRPSRKNDPRSDAKASDANRKSPESTARTTPRLLSRDKSRGRSKQKASRDRHTLPLSLAMKRPGVFRDRKWQERAEGDALIGLSSESTMGEQLRG